MTENTRTVKFYVAFKNENGWTPKYYTGNRFTVTDDYPNFFEMVNVNIRSVAKEVFANNPDIQEVEVTWDSSVTVKRGEQND